MGDGPSGRDQMMTHSVRTSPRRRRASSAQSLAELALVMPVLAMMVLGTLDLGRLFYTQVSLANAAREAAKTASLSPGTFTKNGNTPVLRTAYCELPGFTWNFTPPSVANPCSQANWSSWTDTYSYTYTPVPNSPAANVAYIYIAEDTAFPNDVPGPAPAPNWDATQPLPSKHGKRLGGHLPALVQIDYYWQPITPFMASFFPNGLVHIQVGAQQMEQY
jgi:hypothetical protein